MKENVDDGYKKKIKLYIQYQDKLYKICWARQIKSDGSLLVGFYPSIKDQNLLWATESKQIESLHEPVYKRGDSFKITLHPDGNHNIGGLNVKFKGEQADTGRRLKTQNRQSR